MAVAYSNGCFSRACLTRYNPRMIRALKSVGMFVALVYFLLAACICTSCASTAIERGAHGFRYYSDKNVALEGLDIERTTKPDGTVIEKIKVGKAGGDASSVNAQWAALIGELVRRIPAGVPLAATPAEEPPSPPIVRAERPRPAPPLNDGDWN